MKSTLKVLTTAALLSTALIGSTKAHAATFTVKPDDTLSLYANEYGVSVQNIQSQNNLKSSLIIAGHTMNIDTYVIKKGDTLWGISQLTNLSVSDLKNLNNLTNDLIFPGQVLKLSGTTSSAPVISAATTTAISSTGTYTVKSGDCLSIIAQNHNVTVSDLKTWNNLTSDVIQPDQELKLSGSTVPSSPVVSTPTSATYTVKPGDTLSGIATKNNILVVNLIAWNNLSSTIIHTGQVLKLEGTSSSQSSMTVTPAKPVTSSQPTSTSSSSTSSNTSSSTSTTNNSGVSVISILSINPSKVSASQQAKTSATYTVKAGDTLYGIATKNNILVVNLIAWNNLSSTVIHAGQVLKLEGSTSSKSSTTVTPAKPVTPSQPSSTSSSSTSVKTSSSTSTSNNNSGVSVSSSNSSSNSSKPSASQSANTSNVGAQIVADAEKFLGVPYVWGGESPSGFDCSGLVNYVYNEEGISVSRTSYSLFQGGQRVSEANLQPGELVFYDTDGSGTASHVGVYVGDGNFISAQDNGVKISSMSNPYWAPKFLGAKSYF